MKWLDVFIDENRIYCDGSYSESIDEFRLILGTDSLVIQSVEPPCMKVRLVLYKESDFVGYLPIISEKDCGLAGFADDEPESAFTLGQKSYIGSKGAFYPTIHISVSDFFHEKADCLSIPRYCKIIDSSIWNYYYSLETAERSQDGKTVLLSIIQRIYGNYKNGVYELAVAREHANLSARLLRQSYINGVGGHSVSVSPFVFHSERQICDKITLDFVNFENLYTNYKWRILLIDDYALKPLRKLDGSYVSNEHYHNSKLDIICRDIKNIFPECKICYNSEEGFLNTDDWNKIHNKCLEQYSISFECVESIDKALNTIKDKKYDIILIDYLLAYSDKKCSREYGYSILPLIQSNNDFRGPMGFNSIMFESAFTTAINERLLSEGLTRIDKNWHIAQDACPVNTPILFVYYLCQLMRDRVNRLNDMSPDDKSLINVMEDIFREDKKNKIADSIREKSNFFFNCKFTIESLTKECESENTNHPFSTKKSVFLTQALIGRRSFDNAFFEHFYHLIDLICSGNVLQFSEMWEEYILIRPELGQELSAKVEDIILQYKYNQ